MATIQLWDPVRELLRMDAALARPWRNSASSSISHGRILPVDVREDENVLEVSASLPGFAKDDIDVSLEKGCLTIRAEASNDEDAECRGYLVRERGSGGFYRSLHLSDHVDGTGVTACYTDGVLTLMIPKREESKPKRIEIAVS